MDIYSFEFKGLTIELTLREGNIAYTFQRLHKESGEERSYGYKIKLEDESPTTVMSATALLVMNAVETIELLDQNEKNDVRT